MTRQPMSPTRAVRTLRAALRELLTEAIAHQGQRTSDHEEAVLHLKKQASRLRGLIERAPEEARVMAVLQGDKR